MTYVIGEPCIDVLDRSCAEECPVDCIHEDGRSHYIHPGECGDCGACEPVWPVEAIYYEDDLLEQWKAYTNANARFFAGHPPRPGRRPRLTRRCGEDRRTRCRHRAGGLTPHARRESGMIALAGRGCRRAGATARPAIPGRAEQPLAVKGRPSALAAHYWRAVSRLRTWHYTAAGAYRRTILAAGDLERHELHRPGSAGDRLRHFRTAEQRYLLEAIDCAGVLLPSCVRVSSRAATGLHFSGMALEPRDPVLLNILVHRERGWGGVRLPAGVRGSGHRGRPFAPPHPAVRDRRVPRVGVAAAGQPGAGRGGAGDGCSGPCTRRVRPLGEAR